MSEQRVTSYLDDATCEHLYAWARDVERSEDDAESLAHAIIHFCTRHEYDPCERGASWPTVREMMEREAREAREAGK